ncbi:hypothetical protein AMS68_003159 [Peltaster fructicola]|uniref:ATP-dependent RNA helicase n=1 Tax=Peltaster fructicola TaxID=286661 RepID=A0A6H0XSA1_9PEZI|nr:hypothetical protein AMS68_003159 [Peltaster fructicola]
MRASTQRCSAVLTRALLAVPRSSSGRKAFALNNTRAVRIASSIRAIHQSCSLRQEAFAAELQDKPATTITRFDELENVLHPQLVKTLTQDMRLSEMTEVQSRTINEAIKGSDIIAQARTGTGKTLAFLMPILQNIIKLDPGLAQPNFRRNGPRTTADDIRAIVVSPTRELAEQIAVEAKRLVSGTSVVVQTAVGGTQKSAGLRAIQREGCHILIGTPGRLHDILTDEYSRVQAPDLSALVFDEADRLLDQGFWPAIQDIMRTLPSPEQKDRQTLMFSATVPHEVVDLVRRVLKPGFEFVQCVNQDEEPTHARVAQKLVVTKGLENSMPALTELCMREIKASEEPGSRPFKAIVYFPSTAEVALANELFGSLEKPGSEGDALSQISNAFRRSANSPLGQTEVFEIHAKLTQMQRTRAADSFRRARSGILLSSDVTARGLDFPDVTHVIQMSTPPSQEQYIHRLGRTARAGKEGEGWLIVGDFELNTTRKLLGRLPIKRDDTIETAALDLTRELQVSATAGSTLNMVQAAMRKVSVTSKIKVYRALIGVYQRFSGNKADLIASLNKLSQFGWGLRDPPSIAPGLASKLGLSSVPGIRIGHDPRDESEDNRGGRFGGRNDSGGRRDFGGRGGFGGRDSRDSRSPFGGRDSYPQRGPNSRGGRVNANFGENSGSGRYNF